MSHTYDKIETINTVHKPKFYACCKQSCYIFQSSRLHALKEQLSCVKEVDFDEFMDCFKGKKEYPNIQINQDIESFKDFDSDEYVAVYYILQDEPYGYGCSGSIICDKYNHTVHILVSNYGKIFKYHHYGGTYNTNKYGVKSEFINKDFKIQSNYIQILQVTQPPNIEESLDIIKKLSL